jgi:hypothetical protein
VPALPLRPRSAPQLVDAAVQLARRHYAQFAVLGAIALLPSVVVQIYNIYALGQSNTRVGRMFLLLGLTILWRSLVDAAILFAAAEAYAGRAVSVEHALRQAAARIPSLLQAILVKWMAICFGLFFFIVPGVLLFARYFAVPATVVIERLAAAPALDRSRQLAQGNRGKILATLGLGWLLYVAILLGVSLTLSSLAGMFAGEVLAGILVMLVYPMLGILTVLLYFDMRIRKEGYDIEVLARDLPAEAPGRLAS